MQEQLTKSEKYPAPAARASIELIEHQSRHFTQFDFLCLVLDSVPNGVVILNEQRQIVYANKVFNGYVSTSQVDSVLGARVGEALACVHAELEPPGCGTSKYCVTCGALHAMLQAQRGHRSVKECRITRNVDGEWEALDLRVWATPFELNGSSYMIFAAVDIADEKRRTMLERIFFHDIRNTAGFIFGVAELMKMGVPESREQEFSDLLIQASNKLVDEINAQQQLLAAERGELVVEPQELASLDLLHKVIALYETHMVARRRHLHIDEASELFALRSDEALLGRVLGNMVKNALEACAAGETVTLGCRQQAGEAQFWVHNPNYMPPKVQLQVFKRSFSTKEKSRGVGTYSMKLLTERYLHGRISFETSKTEGTTFTASYPLST